MVALKSSPVLSSDRNARLAASREAARLDAILVQRFNAGDESAFVEIVHRYRDKMAQVALGLLRNRADAEEIAQDTFIRAHRGLANFRGDASLAAWLYCIALNLARNRYWYFYRRQRHATLPLDATLSEESPVTYADVVASHDVSPVREVVNNEFTNIIALCSAQLSPGQREILRLRNTLQFSYARIGRTLGIEIGTVKSRVARARRTLRVLLGQAYPECEPDASTFGCFESLRLPSTGRREVACA